MSAFLGPVHYWMYGKIQLLEQMTDRLLALAEDKGWTKNLTARLALNYGQAPTGSLEDIIDRSNIHGWLSQQVNRTEQRFADTVKAILAADSTERQTAMSELFKTLGQEHQLSAEADIDNAYQALSDLLLDGMPCDGGCQIISQDDDELIWQYDPNLHPLCTDYQGQTAFANLREAFIKGVLIDSKLELDPLGAASYRLRKVG